ncbi:Iron-sulfur cluster carrier protein [bioreactor metagenome]|uniref:Iron-sulfur cluster carrier protein n=1 Tax=bioreactor metagenome TaxID=1076179 RepID=A0A645EVV7_9ZZZZ
MENDRILPVEIGTLKVMSVGFMLEHADDAVIWRGPMKISVIQQMLNDVAWGELDCLVVDCPPGTGDEPLSICQMLGDADGAVIVTTPQQVAASDVAKSINFCRQLKFPIVGLIENMSGFVCPHCGEVTDIFASGGGEALASRYGIPFLGKIPLDPRVCRNSDDGTPFIRHSAATPAAAAFNAILQQLQLQMTRSEGTKS